MISVDEYLRTAYRPDCDYVDGEVLERNVGEKDYSDLQSELVHYFRTRRRQWKVYAYAEQRVQVSARRLRVPDICVYVGTAPNEQVFRTPPFTCIEVVSPEDRMERMQERIDDYLRFGVQYIWVIHPPHPPRLGTYQRRCPRGQRRNSSDRKSRSDCAARRNLRGNGRIAP